MVVQFDSQEFENHFLTHESSEKIKNRENSTFSIEKIQKEYAKMRLYCFFTLEK